jgi:hypothetical protein
MPKGPFRPLMITIDLDDEVIRLERDSSGTYIGGVRISAYDEPIPLDHLQSRHVIRALHDTGVVEGFRDQEE